MIVNQKQAARILGKSPTFIQRRVAAGELEATKGPLSRSPLEIPLEAVYRLAAEIAEIERLTADLVTSSEALRSAGRSWDWLQRMRASGEISKVVEYDGKVYLDLEEVMKVSGDQPTGPRPGKGITFGNTEKSRPVLTTPEWQEVIDRAEAARLARLEDLRARFPSVREAGRDAIMTFLLGPDPAPLFFEPPADDGAWEAWLGEEVWGW